MTVLGSYMDHLWIKHTKGMDRALIEYEPPKVISLRVEVAGLLKCRY